MLTVRPGNPKHNVDCRMHCAEPEGEDWQLHQRFLSLPKLLAMITGV